MVLFDLLAKNLGVSVMAVSLLLLAIHGRELLKWGRSIGHLVRSGILLLALAGLATAAGVVDLSVHLDRGVALALEAWDLVTTVWGEL